MGQYTPEDGVAYDMECQLTQAMDVMKTATSGLAQAISFIQEHAPAPETQFRDFVRAHKLLRAIQQARP